MDKLYLISVVVLFLFGNSCFAQTAVPCVDLFDGVPTNGADAYSEPIYLNGQSFGYYNRSIVDSDNQIQTISFNFSGFQWHWAPDSTELEIGPISADQQAFAYYLAPLVNGEYFSNNYGKLRRTCGKDNETLVDGPGPILPQEHGHWNTFNLAQYNVTFWQQLYVPSSKFYQ